MFRKIDLDGNGTIDYTEFVMATIEEKALITNERHRRILLVATRTRYLSTVGSYLGTCKLAKLNLSCKAKPQGPKSTKRVFCVLLYRDFRANFTVTLCCEVNSGRKWEFQYQREIANGTYFHSCTGRARVSARARRPRGRSPGWRARACGRRVQSSGARAWSSCVWGWSSAGRGCVVSPPLRTPRGRNG